MAAPSNKAERLCAMFDSYCKTVLRNESRDIKRALIRRSKRELAMDEPMQYIFDLISYEDTYPSEQLVFYVDGFSCEVYRNSLCKVMLSLPKRQQLVLVLGFWHQWTDEKISRYMEVTPRTVYNLRQRAFQTIRNFYEQQGTDTQIKL
jgi:DNA-directed RNA polymerase specialized sigma24 family protein